MVFCRYSCYLTWCQHWTENHSCWIIQANTGGHSTSHSLSLELTMTPEVCHFGLNRQEVRSLNLPSDRREKQSPVLVGCCAALWHSNPVRPGLIVQFNSFPQDTLTDYLNPSGNKKNRAIFSLMATRFWLYPRTSEGAPRFINPRDLRLRWRRITPHNPSTQGKVTNTGFLQLRATVIHHQH